MKNIRYLIFLGLLFGNAAQAVTWTSCGCHDGGGDFKRSCYSTNGCDTCCSYESPTGSHPTKAKGEVTTTAREDHENKSMMTQILSGTR